MRKLFSVIFAIFILSLVGCDGNGSVHIVYYDTEHGITPNNKPIYDGEYLTEDYLPELSEDGYDFNGWFLYGKKIEPMTYKVYDNVILNGSWTKKESSVQETTNDDTEETETTETNSTENETTEDSENNTTSTDENKSDTTETDSSEKKSYTITYKSEYGTLITTSQNVEENTTIELPDELEYKGYVFKGWKDSSDNVYDAKSQFIVDKDIELEALWVKLLTIKAFINNETVLFEVEYNSLLTPPSVENTEDQTFLGWYKDYNHTIEFDLTKPVTEEICIYAKIYNGICCSQDELKDRLQSITNDELHFVKITDKNPNLPTILDDLEEIECKVNLSLTECTDITEFNEPVFQDKTSLYSIDFPTTVKQLCTNLFSGSSVSYILLDGLTDIEEIPSFFASNCKNLKGISLPTGLKKIGNNAFEECYDLESVTFNEELEIIGNYAFSYCYDLLKLELPDSISELGKGAFSYCNCLAEIKLPKALQKLDDELFYNCIRLTDITIPPSVTFISKTAFEYTINLKSIEFKNKDNWFYTTSLTNATNKENGTEIAVTDIDLNAVSSNGQYLYSTSKIYSASYTELSTVLESLIGIENCYIIITDTKPDVTEINQALLDYLDINIILDMENCNELTVLPSLGFNGCTNLVGIYLPNTITEFELCPFQKCGFENIVIPNSVKSLSSCTFNQCNNLKEVTIGYGVEYIGMALLSNTHNVTKLIFKDTSTWYRTDSATNQYNKTGGTLTDLSNPTKNRDYFYLTYSSYYWYKK